VHVADSPGQVSRHATLAASVSGHLPTVLDGLHARFAGGDWSTRREDNILDGAAPFYGTYECADGKWLSVGSIEPQFFDLLIEKLDMTKADFGGQWDKPRWPEQRQALAQAFRAKSRDAWCALMEGSDICFAPILDMAEAIKHPHNAARETFVERDGVQQPAPAPRFSRTPPELGMPAPAPGANTRDGLSDWGFSVAELDALAAEGAIQD
jgi:alpha-methylacyl-CoA racemase